MIVVLSFHLPREGTETNEQKATSGKNGIRLSFHLPREGTETLRVAHRLRRAGSFHSTYPARGRKLKTSAYIYTLHGSFVPLTP